MNILLKVIATPFSAQLSPLSSTLAAHVPNNVATSVNVQSSRQTTFTVNPSFPGSFHYANSQLPVSQGVQTTSVDGFPSSSKFHMLLSFCLSLRREKSDCVCSVREKTETRLQYRKSCYLLSARGHRQIVAVPQI